LARTRGGKNKNIFREKLLQTLRIFMKLEYS